MRALTDDERRVVMMLAAEIKSDEERQQLLADLDHCMVEATVPDGSILRVAIEHYQRPSGHGREGWLRLFGQISLRDKWICLSG